MESEKTVKNNSKVLMAARNNIRSYVMVIALIVIWITFYFLTDGVYLTFRNISNLFRQMTTTGVIAIGMTICIISGYFDLSAGSVVGATGALAAVAMANWGLSPWIAIGMALVFGVLIGIWQGAWVAYAKVPAFIVTLGGSMIFRGVALMITKSNAIPVKIDAFVVLGQGYIPKTLGIMVVVVGGLLFISSDIKSRNSAKKYGLNISGIGMTVTKYIVTITLLAAFIYVMNAYEGIPIALIILLVLIVVFSFVLKSTRFGKHVYAVGGNSSASKLSGINNEKTVLTVFVILGFLGGLAGILSTARLASALPAAGQNIELDAIAACVIGGVSLSGGKGRIWGAIIGALVMTSLSNGMSLLSLQTFVQYVINGLVLIFAVWFDIINSRKAI